MVEVKSIIGITSNGSVYELENGKYIETMEKRSNGETMRAWYTDEDGIPLDAPDFEIRPCYRQFTEEGDYVLEGFEKVLC